MDKSTIYTHFRLFVDNIWTNVFIVGYVKYKLFDMILKMDCWLNFDWMRPHILLQRDLIRKKYNPYNPYDQKWEQRQS